MCMQIISNFRCIDAIKQSAYAELATDLEINKAVQFLKQRDLNSVEFMRFKILDRFHNLKSLIFQAIDVLKSFENKDTKVASIAVNNLTFVNILVISTVFSFYVENLLKFIKIIFCRKKISPKRRNLPTRPSLLIVTIRML